MVQVVPGIEHILKDTPSWVRKGARVGMLVHPASVDPGLTHVVERFQKTFPGALKVLFGPQHGLWGEKQDNMVLSPHEGPTVWGVPAFSLYGEMLRPTEEMLSGIDVLLVDLQDVGCRVYTFAATVLACMETCAQNGVMVVVADRPNPIGGLSVEGNLLDPSLESFVGPHALPMRHGMTLGELTLLMREERGIDVELELVPMHGWRRRFGFRQTGLPWVFPSPNMPTPETCWVYPGQVLLEGTNLSEGRGTNRPFEIFGAPFIDPFLLRDRLESVRLPGVKFRAFFFEPTFHKWQGRRCGGIQIHVTDELEFRPYATTLWILHLVYREWGDRLEWLKPPYEFEKTRLPLDLLIGDSAIRESLENGMPPDELETLWREPLCSWVARREGYLAYST